MEIERKFVIDNNNKRISNMIEVLLKDKMPDYIEQSYLSFNPEVRIRRRDDKYYLTVKSNGTLSREEYETEISLQSYEELKQKICSNTIIKERYSFKLTSSYTAEIDVYKNELYNLIMVEVEFPNEEEANNFQPLLWFGREVTYDDKFKNKNLATLEQKIE